MCESGYPVSMGPAEPPDDGGLNEWVPFLPRAAVFGSMAAALCGFEGSGASSSSATKCVFLHLTKYAPSKHIPESSCITFPYNSFAET